MTTRVGAGEKRGGNLSRRDRPKVRVQLGKGKLANWSAGRGVKSPLLAESGFRRSQHRARTLDACHVVLEGLWVGGSPTTTYFQAPKGHSDTRGGVNRKNRATSRSLSESGAVQGAGRRGATIDFACVNQQGRSLDAAYSHSDAPMVCLQQLGHGQHPVGEPNSISQASQGPDLQGAQPLAMTALAYVNVLQGEHQRMESL